MNNAVTSEGETRPPTAERGAVSSNGLVLADLTILASAAILIAIWAFLPKDSIGGVAGYLPFHMFVETLSIVVSLMIIAIVWNVGSQEQSSGLFVLCCAMFAVGLIDFGHMLSVSGMPDFVTPSSPQKGIEFWIAARFTAATGFLAAALLPSPSAHLQRNRFPILALFVAVAALTYWAALFHVDELPRFFIPGKGLTPAKVEAEYFIIAIQLPAAFLFWRRARRSRSAIVISMYAAVSLSVLSEAYFAFYVAAHDLFQVLGHIYKIIAYAFIYRAAFVANVREPIERQIEAQSRLRIEVEARRRAEDEIRKINEELEARIQQRTSQIRESQVELLKRAEQLREAHAAALRIMDDAIAARRHAEAGEAALRLRTAELDAVNRELEAFSYSVSHDLRAPLRSIDGFSLALLEDYADQLDDEGRDHLKRVRGATQRMGQLIDDLLKLSRLSRAPMAVASVDLSALARSVAAELQASEPARKVIFDIAPKLEALGDRQLLAIVLENLLGNVWKFTGKHATAHIAFGITEKDGEPAYFVRDDGAGFDMTHVAYLFTPFQRLHNATDFPGTGIGLATVRRVVQRHGGRVWAEGVAEGGATVYFTLPTQGTDADVAPGGTACTTLLDGNGNEQGTDTAD